jgi:hypothetical protein
MTAEWNNEEIMRLRKLRADGTRKIKSKKAFVKKLNKDIDLFLKKGGVIECLPDCAYSIKPLRDSALWVTENDYQSTPFQMAEL